jgi:hypothetical protein
MYAASTLILTITMLANSIPNPDILLAMFYTKPIRDIELADYLTLFANFRSNSTLFDTI